MYISKYILSEYILSMRILVNDEAITQYRLFFSQIAGGMEHDQQKLRDSSEY